MCKCVISTKVKPDKAYLSAAEGSFKKQFYNDRIAHGLITVDGQMIPFLPVTSGRWKVNTIEFQFSNDWFWKTTRLLKYCQKCLLYLHENVGITQLPQFSWTFQ